MGRGVKKDDEVCQVYGMSSMWGKTRTSQAKKNRRCNWKNIYVSVRNVGYIAMMAMFKGLTNQNCYQELSIRLQERIERDLVGVWLGSKIFL